MLHWFTYLPEFIYCGRQMPSSAMISRTICSLALMPCEETNK
jgi:hypothetical protein